MLTPGIYNERSKSTVSWNMDDALIRRIRPGRYSISCAWCKKSAWSGWRHMVLMIRRGSLQERCARSQPCLASVDAALNQDNAVGYAADQMHRVDKNAHVHLGIARGTPLRSTDRISIAKVLFASLGKRAFQTSEKR
jgi:hypothetical protein